MSGLCVPANDSKSSIFSFENIHQAYLDCRKNKRNTINALRIEINAADNIIQLEEAAMSKLYYEALSKIPKRFIDDGTRCTEWEVGKTVIIANPKYAPMHYKKGKWSFLKLKRMTATEVIAHNLTGFKKTAGEVVDRAVTELICETLANHINQKGVTHGKTKSNRGVCDCAVAGKGERPDSSA